MRIGRKTFVEEEIPDSLPFTVGIVSFVLGVTDPAKLIVGGRGFSAVTFAYQLYHSFAGVDPAA